MKRRDFLTLLASLPAGRVLAAQGGEAQGHAVVVEAERFTDLLRAEDIPFA